MKKYYPILLSKAGELTALRQLELSVKTDICPIIEITPSPKGRIDEMALFLPKHWSFKGNKVIIDFSWYTDFSLESIREIKKFFNLMLKSGVNVIPAIQKNSPTNYVDFVREFISKKQTDICIRSSNRSGGFLTYNSDINDILTNLGTTSDKTILLLDLGLADVNNHAILATIAGVSINSLKPTKNSWLEIIVAAGSFPENLTDLTVRATPHKLRRYEWDMWETIKISLPNVRYGDFGTKSPFYSEAPYAGSISVKYSAKNEFIIYRGELTDRHHLGHGQYIVHAHSLVASSDYSGSTFSWGDLQISQIADEDVNDAKRRTGNPNSWVQFSQNHHITLLNSLL